MCEYLLPDEEFLFVMLMSSLLLESKVMCEGERLVSVMENKNDHLFEIRWYETRSIDHFPSISLVVTVAPPAFLTFVWVHLLAPTPRANP